MDKTALFKISYGLYVVGTKAGDKKSGSIVNTFMQATDEPTAAILCCNSNNDTTKSIIESGEFVISVLPMEVDPFIIANFGFQSGRDVDKWANVGYHEMSDMPVVDNCSAYYYCKVRESHTLLTHTVFFCDVVETSKFDLKPLTYDYYQSDLKQKTMAAFKAFKGEAEPEKSASVKTKEKWVCTVCGYVYDGDIPFEDLPEDWLCPLCKHGKGVFVKEV